MIKTMYVFIGLALVAAFVSIFLSNYASAPNEPVASAPEPVAVMCTADAMLCPDGSFGKREGSDCQFVCKANSTSSDVVDLGSPIIVETPRPNSVISSPLSLVGKARGYWFFEATAPVELLDGSGKVIGQGIITSAGDWMTEEYVTFTGTVNFVNSYFDSQLTTQKNGIVRFKNDNPSGLPEKELALEVPIRFAP